MKIAGVCYLLALSTSNIKKENKMVIIISFFAGVIFAMLMFLAIVGDDRKPRVEVLPYPPLTDKRVVVMKYLEKKRVKETKAKLPDGQWFNPNENIDRCIEKIKSI
jgi:hypothetical protein